MKTDEFNEHYEIDRKSKGVKATAKNGEREMPKPCHTADGEVYDPGETYYFFDSATVQIRQSTGLRRIDEHLCTFGLRVVAVAQLRLHRDDALTDGQEFLGSEIKRLHKRIADYELEKSGNSRSLKAFLMAKE